jgi:adenine-specific DNA methylase
VLDKARRDLARFYPVYADFEPLVKNVKSYERQPMQLVPLKDEGTPDINALNVGFGEDYLKLNSNPRWVAKPTVAYLWARTVTCKNCRAILPLLKTRWLCKRANKRVLLSMEPNADKTGVVFGIETCVPIKGGNVAQRREHDKRIGAGTMSRAGAKCPCCGTIMTTEDIRVAGQTRKLGLTLTAVAVEGQQTKEHRLPTEVELHAACDAGKSLAVAFADVPFGQLDEPTPAGGGRGAGRAFSVQGYGLMHWSDMFTTRQLVALAWMCKASRSARSELRAAGYDDAWAEAIAAYLACGLDRLVDFANVNTQWKVDADTINHALVRFAIQITWDFAEGNPLSLSAGAYTLCINRIATGLDTLMQLPGDIVRPAVLCSSAQSQLPKADIVLTDPPYYDAIPYSDLMDWFYVWLRRTVFDLDSNFRVTMKAPLGPKWNASTADGELVDDESRHEGDAGKSKLAYEEGMAKCFRQCADALGEHGRLVIVFANKQPDAWETLVSSVIKAGFIVESSWPIQPEQPSRMRGLSSAALASSVWLVCKKRPVDAKVGWDNKVLDEMRINIGQRLRGFWDAGIRGPDFVWAATGPALEAYSKHPVVKIANDPGQVLSVSEFLNHARRMVVDFVVGRVLEKSGEPVAEAAVDRLDELTAYYLLHRNDFGMEDAPAGACILYATACSLADEELVRDWDLLAKTRGDEASNEGNDDVEADEEPQEAGSGSKVKLKAWNQRRGRSMGYEASGGRPVPLIDRIHRLMHLWKGGDVHKVDEYLDEHGLRRHELFRRVLQSLIELSKPRSDERSLLESLSNHIGAKGARRSEQPTLAFGDDE